MNGFIIFRQRRHYCPVDHANKYASAQVKADEALRPRARWRY